MVQLHGFVISSVLIVSIAVVFGGEVPDYQISALQALYNSTNGSYWNWNANVTANGIPWNFTDADANPCLDGWQGIECTTNCAQVSVCDVVGISLSSYSLIGSLPDSLNLLSFLEVLELSSNVLLGEVPPTVGMLYQLQSLDLSSNQLSGPVLSTVVTLPRLESLIIEHNSFTGPIPEDINLMSSLVGLYLRENKFSGTIPTAISELGNLAGLDLFINEVEGTLPYAIGCLTNLAYLDFYTNFFTGQVPSSLQSLSLLTFVSFGNNKFTGTIPTYLGTFSQLVVLGISYNSFESTMPASFSSLSGLRFFSCRNNLMTGDMSFMLSLPLLELYLAGYNYFTGSFDEINISQFLVTLRMEYNFFTGAALLPNLCSDRALVELVVSHNEFSGSIPDCAHNWTSLATIDLASNHFSGTLTTSFHDLPALNTVDLSANHLIGSLANIFNDVQTLAVSDNELTGPLPMSTFNSTTLQSFIASKNCFTGSLSSDICAASSLQTLALSGLNAAHTCKVALPFNRYTVDFFQGDIPGCIFNMPLLEQLFLSGNLIVGKLAELKPGSMLQNISLSYNRLTGTIPSSFQLQPYLRTLDLSYNRLLGTIASMSNATLDHDAGLVVHLQANALSGNVPDQFENSQADINLLSGNMFSCVNTEELPQNDPKANKYSCGSNLLFIAIIFTAVSLVLISSSGMWRFYKDQSDEGMWRFYKDQSDEGMWRFYKDQSDEGVLFDEFSFVVLMRHLVDQFLKPPFVTLSDLTGSEFSFYHNVEVLRNFCLFCTLISLFSLVVVLPFIVSFSLDNRYLSQTYQYGWIMALTFFRGVAPGVAIMVLWLVLIGLCMWYEYMFNERRVAPVGKRIRGMSDMSDESSRSSDTGLGEDSGVDSKYDVFLKKFLIVAVSIVVSCLINVAYVYTVLYESLTLQTIALTLLVVTKLAWMYLVVIPWLKQVNSQFLLILGVMVANVIVIPMIVTMAVDVSCFNQYFYDSAPISTEYTYDICSLYDDDLSCIGYASNSASVTIAAPIIYSYQCFSVVLLNYIPMYLITYGAVGIFGPVLQLIICLYYADAAIKGDEARLRQIKHLRTRWWFPFHYLFPIACEADLLALSMGELAAVRGMPGKSDTDGTRARTRTGSAERRIPRSNFYLSKYKALNCVLSLVVMLTFGFCFAPLAVVMLLNIVATVAAYHTCIYFHSLQVVKLSKECQTLWAAILLRETAVLQKIVYGCRTLVYLFCCLFACFAINDLVGVVNRGIANALMSTLAVCTLAANRAFFCSQSKERKADLNKELEQELPDVISSPDEVSTANPIHTPK